MASIAASILLATAATTASPAGNAAGRATKARPPPMPQRRKMPYLQEKDLQELMGAKNYNPQQDKNWMSVSEDVEFLPLMKNNNNEKARRKVMKANTASRSLEEDEADEAYDGTTTGAYTNYDPFSVQPFVEGMNEYDEYQQAWRLLGFMIDCNTADDDDEGSHQSGDEITESGCARYVVWAAYVDLEYEGGGIGEYQYFNRTSGEWDDTACYYAEGGSHHSGSGDGNDGEGYGDYNSRCAKMDCHLEDTHFSVLGESFWLY